MVETSLRRLSHERVTSISTYLMERFGYLLGSGMHTRRSLHESSTTHDQGDYDGESPRKNETLAITVRS